MMYQCHLRAKQGSVMHHYAGLRWVVIYIIRTGSNHPKFWKAVITPFGGMPADSIPVSPEYFWAEIDWVQELSNHTKQQLDKLYLTIILISGMMPPVLQPARKKQETCSFSFVPVYDVAMPLARQTRVSNAPWCQFFSFSFVPVYDVSMPLARQTRVSNAP